MDAKVKTLTRALAWVVWGAALMLAPGVAQTMGEGGSLPFGYYLWTSAIPLAFVATALAWTVRSRLSRWRRPLTIAALAVLLAYLVVLFASCTGNMRLGFALRLDEERCVLYLRGRGAGELQAHVLLKIALGLSTPEVCEGAARCSRDRERLPGAGLRAARGSHEPPTFRSSYP